MSLECKTLSHTLQCHTHYIKPFTAWIFKRKETGDVRKTFFSPFKDNMFLRKGEAHNYEMSEQSWSIAK